MARERDIRIPLGSPPPPGARRLSGLEPESVEVAQGEVAQGEVVQGEVVQGAARATQGAAQASSERRAGLVRASQMLERARASAAPEWTWRETAGRLCELAGGKAGANLSLAASLVRDAQMRGESVAWIQTRSSSFFPADLADCGVDLAALIVVRPPRPADLGLATEWIARSGAFGLIVLDLTSLPFAPLAMQSRLLALAQKHDLGLVCLTEKSPQQASLSSLVSLRADTFLRRRSNLLADALAGSLASSAWGDVGFDAGINAGINAGNNAGNGLATDASAEHARSCEQASRWSTEPNASSTKLETTPVLDAVQLLASFECELNVAKDKRRSRPWRHCEMRRGTPGLC